MKDVQISTEPSMVQQTMQDIVKRTSSNNMLCLVEYKPLNEEEQDLVEDIFRVSA